MDSSYLTYVRDDMATKSKRAEVTIGSQVVDADVFIVEKVGDFGLKVFTQIYDGEGDATNVTTYDIEGNKIINADLEILEVYTKKLREGLVNAFYIFIEEEESNEIDIFELEKVIDSGK